MGIIVDPTYRTNQSLPSCSTFSKKSLLASLNGMSSSEDQFGFQDPQPLEVFQRERDSIKSKRLSTILVNERAL